MVFWAGLYQLSMKVFQQISTGCHGVVWRSEDFCEGVGAGKVPVVSEGVPAGSKHRLYIRELL